MCLGFAGDRFAVIMKLFTCLNSKKSASQMSDGVWFATVIYILRYLWMFATCLHKNVGAEHLIQWCITAILSVSLVL